MLSPKLCSKITIKKDVNAYLFSVNMMESVVSHLTKKKKIKMHLRECHKSLAMILYPITLKV